MHFKYEKRTDAPTELLLDCTPLEITTTTLLMISEIYSALLSINAGLAELFRADILICLRSADSPVWNRPMAPASGTAILVDASELRRQKGEEVNGDAQNG